MDARAATGASGQDFFAPRSTVPVAGAAVASEIQNVISQPAPRKKRAKKSSKDDGTGKAVKKKPQRKVPSAPILYSPETAMKRVKRQEFLFGTSSQLAREESPSFIRDLQAAIQESETVPLPPEDGFDELILREAELSEELGVEHQRCLPRGRKNLWTAAARDLDSCMLQPADKVCYGTCPKGEQELAPQRGERSLVNEDSMPKADAHDESIFDHIAEVADSRSKTQGAKEDNWLPIEDVEVISANEQHCRTASHINQKGAVQDSPPNFYASLDSPLTLTDDRVLQQLVPNLGFHNTKARPTAKRSQSLKGRLPTESEAATSDITIARKPRGRPKKNPDEPSKPRTRKQKATPVDLRKSIETPIQDIGHSVVTEWHNLDDIQDSEPSLAPSPPRRRLTPPKSGPESLELTSPSRGTASKLSKTTAKAARPIKPAGPEWEALRPLLFTKITTAVKGQPPTTDLKTPSWWEKMLLYDPIVVEDFTRWLTEKGLVDDEGLAEHLEMIRPWMVQKWCEDNSVCCLWKEGLRGGVRKKY